MTRLIVESYRDSSVNSIMDDIAKKYRIDITKDRLKEDLPVKEIKFKYRTYSECVKMLYNSVGMSEARI